MTNPREQAALDAEQAANELEAAAAHLRRTAGHVRNGAIPRYAAHLLTTRGHLVNAERALEQPGREARRPQSPLARR